jgi:hypothetical protein
LLFDISIGSMRSIHAPAALCIGIASLVTAIDWTPGQEVKTSSGTVKGRAATRPGFQQVSEYVGIPYAAAPVGDLRWLAPEPYKSNGTVHGTVWVSRSDNVGTPLTDFRMSEHPAKNKR